MISIYLKELRSYFSSLIAYIVIVVFLVATGLFIWVYPETSVLQYGYSSMESLFFIAPWVFLFLIPAITMRTFAEEKRIGTLELLFTRPLTDNQIILGKYLATFTLVIFSVLPTLVYYVSIYMLGNPKGNIDSAGVFGSYIGLIGLAAVFCSIGVFASAITDNQIISFIVALILSYLMFSGFNTIATFDVWSGYADLINKIGIDYHYQAMSKGLIDSRDLLYFLSVVVTMLQATKLILGSRKW